MNVQQAIQERRSIRKYKDTDLSGNLIKELIDAARLAPSGNNAQPWAYKVIKSIEIKVKLKENNIFKQEFVYNAPIIIICCADPEAYPRAKLAKGFDDSYELRAIRDLAISSQNLILRAMELGLGTCYIGWMDKIKIKPLLNIPEKYIIPYAIAIGYPAEQPSQRTRKSIPDILL